MNNHTVSMESNIPRLVGEAPNLPIEGRLPLKDERTANAFLIAAAVFGVTSTIAIIAMQQIQPSPTWKGLYEGVAIVSGIFSAILLLVGIIVSAIVFCVHRSHLKEIQQGFYLSRWSYTEDEWRRYIDSELERNRVDYTVCIVLGLIIGGVVGFILSAIPDYGMLMMIPIPIGLSALFVLGSHLFVALKSWHLESIAAQPADAIIGDKGLYFRTGYYPFRSFGYGLKECERSKEDGTDSLVFTFLSKTKNGTTEHVYHVPIPQGKGREATAIVKRLRSV